MIVFSLNRKLWGQHAPLKCFNGYTMMREQEGDRSGVEEDPDKAQTLQNSSQTKCGNQETDVAPEVQSRGGASVLPPGPNRHKKKFQLRSTDSRCNAFMLALTSSELNLNLDNDTAHQVFTDQLHIGEGA